MTKKEPRWVTAFLRALERTGEVRAAAEDAGIDHSTAYARRRSHGAFAEAWAGALRAYAVRVEAENAGGLEALSSRLSPLSCAESPSPLKGRGEVVASASQLRRAGHDRWSGRKEKLFFAELAATANVKQAARTAGVSPNAVYQRRLRDAHFKAKWAAVLETGRASIEMRLVEAANKTFEPEELDTGAVEPKVSVAEAIRIVQLHGSAKQREELPDPFVEEAAVMSEEDVAELRERILRKLRRLRDRDMPDRIAEGWSFDEAHDQMVPPGWTRPAD